MDWHNYFGGAWGTPLGPVGGFFFFIIVVWSLVWKGMALWRAAHEESKPWFVALLIINTVGILDILYLYVFSKKRGVSKKEDVPVVSL